jgi:hypothetical protein
MIMRGFLGYALGSGLALNGLIMLVLPRPWYDAIPGVTGTGPFNPHFVRDIGAAYLVCGAALAWFAARPAARSAAQFAAGFLGVHALVHAWDVLAGREAWTQLPLDLPSIFVPPALAIWIAWPRRPFQTGVQTHDPLVP